MVSEGNACTALGVKEGLGIGKGSVRNYLLRAVERYPELVWLLKDEVGQEVLPSQARSSSF
jgi:hypothetical protein